MITTPLDKILFMDIETVGCEETYKKLQKSNKELAFQFNHYLDYFQKKYSEEAESTVDQLFVNKAALTPEFAKIVCISFAFMVGGEVRVQSFSGDNEKVILEGAKDIIIKTELPDSTEKYGRIINVISTSVKQPLKNLGVSNGELLTVSTEHGALSLNVEISDMVDDDQPCPSPCNEQTSQPDSLKPHHGYASLYSK